MFEYKPLFPKIEIKKKFKKTAKRVHIHDIEKPKKLHCRKCGIYNKTCCYRHMETFRKFEVGKGVGQKCNDKYTFWGCSKCDKIMSEKPDKSDELKVFIHAEEWLWLIIKTWIDE